MPIVEHEQQPWTQTRPGVEWRFISGGVAADGKAVGPGLTMFYQRFQPGYGVPRHRHGEGQEILTMLQGEAEVLLGEDVRSASAGTSIVVPEGVVHSFRNVGAGELWVQCVLNTDAMRAQFLEDPQGKPAAYCS